MKQWLIGLVCVLVGLVLVGCSWQAIATINGDYISKEAYYNRMKNSAAGRQTLQEMILEKALNQQYGKQVTTSEVKRQYQRYQNQSGMSFKAFLTQNDLTATQLKNRIRESLLLKAAVQVNTKLTPKLLRHHFKTYHPKVSVAQILTSSRATAEKAIQQLAAGKSFASLAKKYSIDAATKDKGGEMASFDSTNSSLDTNFKAAAFKLKDGQYTTTPVKTSYGYEVIKMRHQARKGTVSDHKKELTDQVVSAKMNDPEALRGIVTKVLRQAKITIHDKGMQHALAGYINQSAKMM
ncbi:foldase protein PrsA [Lentilactobacillus fungorum]|uniref:Foldase protein PrsA n=1 Tax=Lentilactobacillus fungorum TaxID=2201250 RepID=A0ABQ3VZS2_9LACO|nr:peptidylprolyl isomerase [Lentilactobacillus fungorum]GHP14410.1 foldase protein PrsA [Lentilactobacillus fungorum]